MLALIFAASVATEELESFALEATNLSVLVSDSSLVEEGLVPSQESTASSINKNTHML